MKKNLLKINLSITGERNHFPLAFVTRFLGMIHRLRIQKIRSAGMHNLFVLLPCYNEEKNIYSLTRKWEALKMPLLNKQQLFLHIVFVNDGSTDKTIRKIKNVKKLFSNITLLNHHKNAGLGNAVKTSLRYFYNNGKDGDYAVIMDADNSHDPRHIIKMLKANGKDNNRCVIASRYCKKSEEKGVPALRNWLSLNARYFYTVLLKVPHVRDYTCGYRLYPYAAVYRLIRNSNRRFVTQRGFACMMELLYNLYREGATFREIPIKLRYDLKRGDSKMKIASTIRSSVITAVKLRMKG